MSDQTPLDSSKSGSEPLRWTLLGEPGTAASAVGPNIPDWETVEVMPVSEHEELLRYVRGAVELWDEAHETDNSIALGAAFVALRARCLSSSTSTPSL